MGLGNIQEFFGSLPLDWIVLSVIVIVVALDSLRSGIGRALAVSVALPLTYLLFTLADSAFLTWAQGLFSTPFMQVAVFAALFVAVYVLVRRMGLDYVDSGMGEPVQAILAGVATAVVFVCIWLQEPVLGNLWQMSGQIVTAFSEQFRLWWLLGAYAALAFARG
jgi:hypothetical protein